MIACLKTVAVACGGGGHKELTVRAVTQLSCADHGAPIFHDERDGQWQVVSDDPAGDKTVDIIVDAITTARDTMPGWTRPARVSTLLIRWISR